MTLTSIRQCGFSLASLGLLAHIGVEDFYASL
jgi:hypothetical protein